MARLGNAGSLVRVLAPVVVALGCGGGSGTPAGDGSSGGDQSGDRGGNGGAGGTGAAGGGGAGGSAGGGGAGACEPSYIAADRRVAWAPGVPGGIPTRTTICANVKDAPYGAKGDGMASDSAAIQAALDKCPAGQVVLVPAGTYRLTKGISIPSGVTLRGEGPTKSKLEGDGVADKFLVQAGSWDESGSPTSAVTAGLARGSATLTLANASTFKVGDFVIVDQLNDDDLVRAGGQDIDASESPCIWGSREDGKRLLGQMVEVKSLDAAAKTIGIDPPLAMTLSAKLSPEIERVRAKVTVDVGIEDLKVSDRSFRGDNNSNIRLWGVARSWVKNVESAFVSGRHIELTKCFRCEVRDSYIHHAHNYMPGGNGYGIVLDNQTSESLVENNISFYLNANIMLSSNGPGNVLGYNYSDRTYAGDYPSGAWLGADQVANHCGHPFMALVEGNMASQIGADNIHGSSSHQTFFRNAIDRQHTGLVHTGNLLDIVFAANNRFMNVVGNVLGRPGDKSLKGAAYDQSGGNCVGTVSVYKLGYPSNCAVGKVSDPMVAATLLRHGNFDYVNDKTMWDPAIASRCLPPSLYLKGKPAWFGATPWPPIGPDVTPMVNDIPAKTRFDALPSP